MVNLPFDITGELSRFTLSIAGTIIGSTKTRLDLPVLSFGTIIDEHD